MKNLRKSFLVQPLLAVALIALLALPALAQTTGENYARVYRLTNSTTFTYAGAGTNMANGAITTINSQPFPMKAGRGFAVQLEFVATNAATLAVTPYFQFAVPIYVGTTLTTNWGAVVAGPAGTLNGTTRVYSYGLVAPTTADNVVYGRLAYVSNGHSAYVTLSPTNTFVAITAP